ncbi:MAG: dihydrodipicolinate synthase family protein [Pantoea sp.]|uniref:dihydrodipicolinate synthase family protein n=1 Tax=Pantoea sp. TaxID=69393 RepID=UPI000EC6C856|nr:dihydrodipicolinate synthase family protein [Pantoea sp.]MDU6078421.1 dihydrodipicolinate synthase family protein [Pantoea sp.]MDU7840158.1 dihydrodipicolinate synthase family protein [Pantoea sp.]HAB23828.1 dihydrodipicolinate synthase family protein [Pantoea sp.]
MFTGLSAFPLTPVTASGIDEKGFSRILARLTAANVDAICALGSTGSYAYLTRQQRARVATLAVEQAEKIPVMICIGAVSTSEVLHLADDAQRAGARALLLPPVSYQKLSEDEVFSLFETVSRHVSVPVCVYDNPATTHFTFSSDLYRRIAMLSHIESVKIPGVPDEAEQARSHINQLRALLPRRISIGVSVDAVAGMALNAGCDLWYSVCGGLFPRTAKAITVAAAQGDRARVTQLSARLSPLWALYRKHGGSIRVMAAAAGVLGVTDPDCLSRPLQPLSVAHQAEIAAVISALELS